MSSEFPDPDISNKADLDAPDSNSAPTEIVEASVAEPVLAEPAIDPMANVDGDELSFLHPTSLVFDLLAHGKSYLVPAAFGLWGAAQGDLTLLIVSALIFIPAFLSSVFRYFTFRYCIKDGQLIVRHGLIFRNVRTVPVSRIQNIDFVQNPLHRILSVAEVKIETASGTKPEATLRVLSLTQLESLRTDVFERKSAAETDAPKLPDAELSESASSELNPAGIDPVVGNNVPSMLPQESLLEIPLSWLIKAGLASNRGMLIVGVLMGIYWQFGGNQRSLFNFDWFRDLWAADTPVTTIVGTVIAGLFAMFVLVRLLGVGWYVLRFFGYKLVKKGDDFRISCGLITKVSATVPRRRIQFISIHRSLIMRMMGLASIRIETAGGAGQDSENATESVSKRWFIPVIPENRIVELIKVLRPELDWNEDEFEFQPVSPLAGRRLCRLAIVQSLIFAAIGLGISQPWGWALGLFVLPLFIGWAIKKSKSMRYARMTNGVVYRSGVFNRKTSVTFFDKIQTLRLDQSPFDRRWKMARLSVDTAASGPADHRIEVPYLDANFAQQELEVLREKTGKNQPVFA